MAERPKPPPIDDYLRTVPEDRRRSLVDLRAKIRSVVPEAEECISYRMPAFRLHGAIVTGFHAPKKGCSYSPFSGSTLRTVAPFVRAYAQTKSVLHFTPDKPLPMTLVRRLIKARIADSYATVPTATSGATGWIAPTFQPGEWPIQGWPGGDRRAFPAATACSLE